MYKNVMDILIKTEDVTAALETAIQLALALSELPPEERDKPAAYQGAAGRAAEIIA